MKAFFVAGEGLYGNISAMAKRLGISRSSLYRFIASNPEAAAFIASQRDEFDDLAEDALRQKILKGDSTLLKFYASTKLRGRGYSDPLKDDADKTVPEFKVTITSEKQG